MRQYHTQFSQYTSRRPKVSFWRRFFGANKKVNHNTVIRPPRDSWTASNPWRQPAKQRNWRFTTTLVMLGVLFLFWLGLMLFLPYFRMVKVTVTGAKIINQSEVETYLTDTYLKSGQFWPSNNYFLVNADKIYSDLKQKYLVDELKVTKIFPKELKIEMVEKNSAIIYDNGLKTYLLDQAGTVISELWSDVIFYPEVTLPSGNIGINTSTLGPASSSSLTLEADVNIASGQATTTPYKPDLSKFNTFDLKYLPVIYDTRLIPVEVKQTAVLPAELLTTVSDWQSMVQKGGIGKVRYFELESLTTGIRSYLDKAWYIVFNPQNELETQISNLKTLLRDVKPTEYVNLYYGERIFWK